MAISNAWVFTNTVFDAETFLQNTGNVYQFVGQRAYKSKKNPEDIGVTLTLLIIKDNTDYGHDKQTGLKRDNNQLNSFDVTILNGQETVELNKGNKVSLGGYLPDKSFVIGFDLILRFKEVVKIDANKK